LGVFGTALTPGWGNIGATNWQNKASGKESERF